MPKVEYFGQNIIFICVGDIVVLEIFLAMLYMVMMGIRIVMMRILMIISIGCMMLMRSILMIISLECMMMRVRILMIISLGSIRQELGLAGARGGEIPHKWFLVRWIGCTMFH